MLQRPEVTRVFATCRSPERAYELMALTRSDSNESSKLQVLPLDVTNENTIEHASKTVASSGVTGLDLLLQTSGILHDGDMRPETSLQRMRKVCQPLAACGEKTSEILGLDGVSFATDQCRLTLSVPLL